MWQINQIISPLMSFIWNDGGSKEKKSKRSHISKINHKRIYQMALKSGNADKSPVCGCENIYCSTTQKKLGWKFENLWLNILYNVNILCLSNNKMCTLHTQYQVNLLDEQGGSIIIKIYVTWFNLNRKMKRTSITFC